MPIRKYQNLYTRNLDYLHNLVNKYILPRIAYLVEDDSISAADKRDKNKLIQS